MVAGAVGERVSRTFTDNYKHEKADNDGPDRRLLARLVVVGCHDSHV